MYAISALGQHKETKDSQEPAASIAEPRELSKEEYALVKAEFIDLAITEDPKVALSKLREQIKTDEALLRSCHSLMHEIGRQAYEKYGSFAEAIKYSDEICNSGYLHGIIEAHFYQSPDVWTAMQKVCDPYPEGKFLSWECYHGVGHGLMYYSENDLPSSLAMCGSYGTYFAQSSCVNGVFMENFNSEQDLHKSKFLDPENPFYPCELQAPEHKGDCYLYAPTYYLSLHTNDYSGALSWCQDAELLYRSSCARGVGTQAMKENINNPELVESVCLGGSKGQVDPCIMGMVDLYTNHHGSPEASKKLCLELSKANREACDLSVVSSSKLF